MARRRDSYLSPPLPRVLAHRGLALAAPENTLLAFLHALAIGVTHLETDVHASSDGVAVICHDPDLTRLLGSDLRVADLTFAELSALELGHGQHFASLRQALRAFPDARFNIDVKSADAVQPTIDAVLAARAVHRVLVTSFDEARARRTAEGLPGASTSASSIRVAVALLACATGLASFVARSLRGIDALQVPERYGVVPVVTPRMLRLVHRAGVEVHVWTVNDVVDMRRLLELGVDGIVTDRADLALRVVEEYRHDHGGPAGSSALRTA